MTGKSKASPGRKRTPDPVAPPAFPVIRKFGTHRTEMRLLGPADRDTLLKFFKSHTRETIHLRYGYELSHMTEERAAELVGVDQSRDAAIGIFEYDQEVPLVAIGRYCLKPGGTSAEVAFVVREDRRRLGIATALLSALLAIAASRGLETLDAQVLRENQPMLEIFFGLGGVKSAIPGTGEVTVTIDIRKALRNLGRRRQR